MEKGGGCLEKNRRAMAACCTWWGSASAPMNAGGGMFSLTLLPCVGVTGREIGGVGGTSAAASVSDSRASCRVRKAPRAEIVVMSQAGLSITMGSSERLSERALTAGTSAFGFGGGGGELTCPRPLSEASSMLQVVGRRVGRGECVESPWGFRDRFRTFSEVRRKRVVWYGGELYECLVRV